MLIPQRQDSLQSNMRHCFDWQRWRVAADGSDTGRACTFDIVSSCNNCRACDPWHSPPSHLCSMGPSLWPASLVIHESGEGHYYLRCQNTWFFVTVTPNYILGVQWMFACTVVPHSWWEVVCWRHCRCCNGRLSAGGGEEGRSISSSLTASVSYHHTTERWYFLLGNRLF